MSDKDIVINNIDAGKSEELILKYNPKWTGCGDTVHPVWVPEEYLDYFKI